MAIIGQSASLLFKIDGDASQLHREMRGVEAAFGRLGSNFGSVAGIATVATAAVTAVAAAAVTGAVALFNFTKQAAEYGSTLYDASIQTGLSAEAISALKIAADSSGSSLESIAGSVAKFNVLLGQAAQGNEKAEATLKLYGITAKDTDGALNQAIATIARMETQDQKAAAAKDLFKDRTAAILPVINQVDGKFDEFIETAKKLGVVLSKEDLKAADDFGDTLEVLGTQAKIAGVKFASELMPMVTGAMQSISQYMAANQDVAREWGNQVVYTVQGIQVTFGVFRQAVGDVLSFITLGLINNQNQWLVWGTVVRGVIATVTFGLSEVIRLMAYIGAKTTNTAEGQGVWLGPLAPPKQPSVGGAAKGGGGGRGGGGGGGQSEAARKAEEELNDLIQIQQKKIGRLEKTYDEAMARIRAEFKKTGDENVFTEQAAAEIEKFVNAVGDAREELLKLEDKLNENKSGSKQRLALMKQWDDVKAISTKIRKDREENDELTSDAAQKAADTQKKLFDEIADFAEESSRRIHDTVVKNAEDEIDAAVEVYEQTIRSRRISAKERAQLDYDLAQILARNAGVLRYENKAAFENAVIDLDKWKREKEEEVKAHIKDEEERKAALEAINAEYERRLKLLKDIRDVEEGKIQGKEAIPVPAGPESPMDRTIKQWKDLKTAMEDVVGMENILASFGQMAITMFENMANAVGNAVAGWALYGDSIGKALRKALAAELAHIAAVAAVNAIYATALGFLRLAQWDFAGAAAAFKSAALWAAVAGVAAVGAKAVAGNAFKQQANTATGSGASGQRSGGGGGAYSSQPDQTITTGINSPGGGSGGRSSGGLGTLVIRDKSGMFDQLFEMAWERNGRMRRRMQAEFGK